MAQPTLKSLLGKKSETTAWLLTWTTMTKAAIVVEDSQHTILFGTASTDEAQTFPVTLEGEISGYVKGDDQASG